MIGNFGRGRSQCIRLGLKASVLLYRFVNLYRKYNDDQPRDERGRWEETDDEDEDDLTTGGIKSLERTGDPEIDAVTFILADRLEKVIESVGPGSGSSYGTAVHSAFEASVRATGLPGVGVERSWVQGVEVPYGTEESVRTDVSLRDSTTGSVRAVWDVKTGGARMTESRAEQIRTELKVGKDVPIIELHYDRGITIKSMNIFQGAFR